MKTILELLKNLKLTQQTLERDASTLDPLASLTQQFKAVVTPTIANHCYLSSFKSGVLTILVDNPSFYTKLHFMLQEITQKLRQNDSSPPLTKIKLSLARHQRALGAFKAAKESCLTPPPKLVSVPFRSSANTALWQNLIQELKTKNKLND